jgi:hypothetical protein
MTDKQLLAKYEAERGELVAKRATLDTRLSALEDVIGGLRVMLGEPPAATKRKGAGKATGTKALILDVLADGKRRSCPAIADAIKTKASAAGKHLTELVASGDVTREGKSRATTYGVQ